MLIYYNRDTIFDAILLMEKYLYKKQDKQVRSVTRKDYEFESEL